MQHSTIIFFVLAVLAIVLGKAALTLAYLGYRLIKRLIVLISPPVKVIDFNVYSPIFEVFD
jgi:hypothetical protein